VAHITQGRQFHAAAGDTRIQDFGSYPATNAVREFREVFATVFLLATTLLTVSDNAFYSRVLQPLTHYGKGTDPLSMNVHRPTDVPKGIV
jgi:hypothetical protein